MISPERLEELDTAWNYSANLTEDEYRDWFLELTQEEQDLVSVWDRRYFLAVAGLCAYILVLSES